MIFIEKVFFRIVLFKDSRNSQNFRILQGEVKQNVIFFVQIFLQTVLFKNSFFFKIVLFKIYFSSKSCFLKIYFSLKSDAL